MSELHPDPNCLYPRPPILDRKLGGHTLVGAFSQIPLTRYHHYLKIMGGIATAAAVFGLFVVVPITQCFYVRR
jgi:hypothetical protein